MKLNLCNPNPNTMKNKVLATVVTCITLCMPYFANAQDDSYYDPSRDPALQNRSSGNSSNNVQQTDPATDPNKYDGYQLQESTDPSRYDYANQTKSNNTTINNYYYDWDNDWDDWGYTNRLRRYYTPNWGVSYYSYCFTPSFFWGWSSWNTSIYVSSNQWYYDPWWRWNRGWRNRAVVVYDPWYDPYWSYSWGWGSYSYYNTWCDPFWNSYSNYGCRWNNWGWNRGWGNYNCGYNNGYWNGYANGYNNGYYNGYRDGYANGWWNGNGGGWYDPYFFKKNPDNPAGGNPPINNPVANTGNRPPMVVGNNNPGVGTPPTPTNTGRPTQVFRDTEIPREGITRPTGTGKTPVNSDVRDVKAPVTDQPRVVTGTTPPATRDVATPPQQRNDNDPNRWTIREQTPTRPNTQPNTNPVYERNAPVNNDRGNNWNNNREPVPTYDRTPVQPQQRGGGSYERTPPTQQPNRINQSPGNSEPQRNVQPQNTPNQKQERSREYTPRTYEAPRNVQPQQVNPQSDFRERREPVNTTPRTFERQGGSVSPTPTQPTFRNDNNGGNFQRTPPSERGGYQQRSPSSGGSFQRRP